MQKPTITCRWRWRRREGSWRCWHTGRRRTARRRWGPRHSPGNRRGRCGGRSLGWWGGPSWITRRRGGCSWCCTRCLHPHTRSGFGQCRWGCRWGAGVSRSGPPRCHWGSTRQCPSSSECNSLSMSILQLRLYLHAFNLHKTPNKWASERVTINR